MRLHVFEQRVSPEVDKMQILLISLFGRSDRREIAIERCREVGIEAEVLVASSPDDLADAGFVMSPGVSPGNAACVLSHRRALERAAEIDEPTLILEDDVVFDSRITSELPRLLDEMKWRNAGLVQLGWLFNRRLSRAGRAREAVASLPTARRLASRLRPGWHIELERRLLIPSKPGWGTHCYLVAPWYAEGLSASLGPYVFGAADHYLRWFSEINGGCYRTRESLAWQDERLGSDIRCVHAVPSRRQSLRDEGTP